jgi:hypothetical protein
MNAVNPVVDPATERLNYRNGQRLEAADLRAAQDYQIAVRRWLNRSLYTPGIAKGLEVNASDTNKHKVVISPGLALDVYGREIILTAPQEIFAVGVPSATPGVVFGNYLVIEYYEERTAAGAIECQCDGSTAPTRIRVIPKLSVQDGWPSADSGKVLLAQIELKAGCEVADIHTAVRKYVSASKPPKVQSISIEGEKDIDPSNRKRLYFHVSGGYPDTATLYLQAHSFSNLFYSEVGGHQHGLDVATQPGGSQAAHTHVVKFANLKTGPAGSHRHEIWANTEDTGGAIEFDNPDRNERLTGPGGAAGGAANMEVTPAPDHDHSIAVGDITSEPGGGGASHTHQVTGSTKNAGQTGSAMRAGGQYTFFSDLKISLDTNDITAAVLKQIQGRNPGADWSQFGSGNQTHAFVVSGTGEIDLLQLGVDLGPSQHVLEFTVGSGGGQLHYNLYLA